MRQRIAIALTWLFALINFSSAADLSAIDRTIRKEPQYKSKPKYCLLVFGPEATMRVWLVLDGDTLYVDRNANGDLTDEGETILAEKREPSGGNSKTFKVKTLTDGTLTHKNFFMSVSGMYDMYVEVDMPGFKGGATDRRVLYTAGADASGNLEFSEYAKNAPIIHFGGPRQLTLVTKQTLRVNREHDLQLGIGTPGIGIGSFGFIAEGEVLPEKANPKIAITYPPSDGKPPIKEHYELKQRC